MKRRDPAPRGGRRERASGRAWARGGSAQAELLADERWILDRPPSEGQLRVLLVYPSPYPVASASLGYQAVYRLLHEQEGVEVDRAWLPDPAAHPEGSRLPELRGVRSGRPAAEFHLLAFSLAYELELAGVIRLLEAAGLEPLAEQRGPDDPVVLLGGPITWASAELAHPYVDLVLPGEVETVLGPLLVQLTEAGGEKEPLLEALRGGPADPHNLKVELTGDELICSSAAGRWAPVNTILPGEPRLQPPFHRCPDELLPASSAWVTPRSSFGEMFLVEAGRGCNRACTYCVMRCGSSGGLRAVPAARVLAAIPSWVRKVGLVGAAVTDHPQLREILEACIAGGRQVGVSSLRADRLDEQGVGLLQQAGLKTLTTALDGASERLRRQIKRGTGGGEVVQAAQLARRAGVPRFKLYLMIGLPGEEEADLQECLELCLQIAALLPLTLTVSPFVPKPRTPLAGAPFAGVRVLAERLELLRRGLQGKVKLQSVSGRWAWVEYRLATGGVAAGRAALQAVRQGGSLKAWEQALDFRSFLP